MALKGTTMASYSGARLVECLLDYKIYIVDNGSNSYGQLGQGHKEDVLAPSIISDLISIPKQIYAGGGHTFFILDNDEVLSCGWNSKGQLGQGHTEEQLSFVSVQELKDKKIKKIACGWDFSLAVTDKGELFAWGSNSFGQLGLPEIRSYVATPTKVLIEGCLSSGTTPKIVDIAAGLRHSCVLIEQNESHVLTFGSGRKGQLGFLEKENVPSKMLSPQLAFSAPPGVKLIKLVAGAYHTACLTDCGSVYFWGDNKYHQGTELLKEVCISTSQVIPQLKVKDIFSGWTHFLAKTAEGHILSWGRSNYGQLGRCDPAREKESNPGKINNVASPEQICCGSEHNLILNDKNRVISWGWNEHGICGTGDEENVYIPKEMTILENKVTMIGCGYGHCFAVYEEKT